MRVARFFALVVALVLGLALLAALFIAVVDPYGVSFIRVSIPHFNAVKSKRVDIDRYLKPYEVWRYQPKTVFIGTSRVNESLDPSVLDGTEYAPAYNAAIPASKIQENVRNLEAYFALDPNIKHVFVELFFYNFTTTQPESSPPLSFREAAIALNFSADALRDSFETIYFNSRNRPLPPRTSPDGRWLPAALFVPGSPFGAQPYTDDIMKTHSGLPDMPLQGPAIAALDRIVELCRENGATVHLLILPIYPWDDYRLLSLGYWPELQDWLRKMSRYPNVLSFQQYNALLEEPANSARMHWWYDPIHAGANFGRVILQAIKGEQNPDMPANLMEPVTPSTVESVIAERTAGLMAWTKQHPDFVATFDGAKSHYKQVDRMVR